MSNQPGPVHFGLETKLVSYFRAEAELRLIVSIGDLAGWDRATGKWDLATAGFQEALSLARKLAAMEPGNHIYARNLCVILSDYAFTLLQSGTRTHVPELLEESIVMERSFLIQAPKDSTVTRGLAISLRNLGQAHMDAEAFDQARQPLEEARDLMESLLEDQGAQRDFVFIAATVLDPLGWLDWQMGLPVRAGARSSRTLDLLRSVEPDEHTARYLEVLAAAEAHAAIITRAPGPGDDSGNATEDRR